MSDPAGLTPTSRSAGSWGVLFLLAGIGAMVGLVLIGSPVGVAVDVFLWGFTVFAGYRIWRGRHPRESAKAAIGLRVRLVLGLFATGVAVAFIEAFPEIALLIIGGYVLLMVGFVVLLALVERSVPQENPERAGPTDT